MWRKKFYYFYFFFIKREREKERINSVTFYVVVFSLLSLISFHIPMTFYALYEWHVRMKNKIKTKKKFLMKKYCSKEQTIFVYFDFIFHLGINFWDFYAKHFILLLISTNGYIIILFYFFFIIHGIAMNLL